MSELIKSILSWLSMKRGDCLFVDSVSGENVYEYTDRYGVKWMANYNRFFFRVKRHEND